jgi:hypothetical protein
MGGLPTPIGAEFPSPALGFDRSAADRARQGWPCRRLPSSTPIAGLACQTGAPAFLGAPEGAAANGPMVAVTATVDGIEMPALPDGVEQRPSSLSLVALPSEDISRLGSKSEFCRHRADVVLAIPEPPVLLVELEGARFRVVLPFGHAMLSELSQDRRQLSRATVTVTLRRNSERRACASLSCATVAPARSSPPAEQRARAALGTPERLGGLLGLP